MNAIFNQITANGYKFKYLSHGDKKNGSFEKSYEEIIDGNYVQEKYIMGNFLNDVLHDKYLVRYCEYFINCHTCYPNSDDSYEYEMSAYIIFSHGDIQSYVIQINRKSIDELSDDHSKILAVRLLNLDIKSKKYLFDKLKINNLPILSNLLNRFESEPK